MPRQREADGILEHGRCSVLRVHHVQVERESNLQAPGVARMFRCSAFDALNTWSEALGESFDVLKLWSEALGE